MITRNFFTSAAASLIAAFAFGAPVHDASADEVYFDTVSTKRVARPHGAYLGLFGGINSRQNINTQNEQLERFSPNDETGWFIGGEFGYEFQTPYPFRPSVEAEFFYTGYDFNATGEFGVSTASAEVYHLSLMFNAILALDLSDQEREVGPFMAAFHPYIGVGLGPSYSGARNSKIVTPTSVTNFDASSELSMAYQVFAGIEFDVSEYVSLYGEYRWLYIHDLPGGGLGKGELGLWNVGVKVRY